MGRAPSHPKAEESVGAMEQYPYGTAVKSEEVQEMLFFSEKIYRRI